MAGLAVTFVIMAFGVSKGIEKMNKIMMPLFLYSFISHDPCADPGECGCGI